MTFPKAVRIYVFSVVVAAALVLGVTSVLPRPGFDAWAVFSFLFVGCLLELSRTHNKAGGLTGSLVFVFHLAVGLVLGAFLGALIAALAKAIAKIVERDSPLRLAFNVAERSISVGLTFTVYYLLGGQHPPQFLLPAVPGHPAVFNAALVQIGAFLVAALIYFVANSLLVSTVVALANDRPVLRTWRSNTMWVLGYDIAASMLALLVAGVFVRTNSASGLERFAFLALALPLLGFRHIYGKLNNLQDLYGELDGAYDQLELNVREQLAMMVKAIEARDPYTSGHSRRVCGLSRAIATDLGLTPEQVEEIENAALLHDVGKIHAEFAPLLQKEGKLTEEEWAIMKTHSAKSADLVGLFSRFQGYVVSCVRHHHERWDGRGYPDQVSGEAIPLGARIITIADTIDAMTTNRPYRNALSLDVVLAELNKGRGSQFDTSLVDVTVNSVTVRRLISDPSLIPEYLPSPKIRDRAVEARRKAGAALSGLGTVRRAADRPA
ncbi:MAG TPA: HD-GYP domain-containing protein [Gemmatimonadales bacterium]|jgi:HD-GYP domain-containing protein (c-di-GMP phosphodiesterase class II)